MLSQTAEYALRAAVAVAMRQPEAPTHNQLAAATGIPPQYLYKILQFLSRAGLIRIHRGRAGGYTLARPAHTISYLEVLRTVDGRPPSTELPHQAAVAVARFESSLAAATLADATRANDHAEPTPPLTLRHPPEPAAAPPPPRDDWACWNARAS